MTDKNGNNNNNENGTNGTNAGLRLLPEAAMKKHEVIAPSANSNAYAQKATPSKTQHAVGKTKKKRRDKSDLGDDFVPPDGGWGWLVAIASGINILVTFAPGQQFGIIFGDRLSVLGFSSSQLTTIINLQIAVSAFTGLLNGPLFRRYSYRQVALVGSVLTFIGLFEIVFADTFGMYLLGFSIIYGFGRGLTVSASSLAVNTYFKQKRRAATAYQFGVAGLGPIVGPYLATYLIDVLAVQGTVAIFAALSLNTIACSLVYQPVKWHVVKRDKDAEALQTKTPIDEDDEDDDIIKQIVEPDTPVLPRANDGWFGSRASLNSSGARSRLGTMERQQQTNGFELKRLNSKDSGNAKPRSFSVSYSIKEEDHDEDNYETKEPLMLTSSLPPTDPKALPPLATPEDDEEDELARRKKLPFYKKIIIFFDLDLLRDLTYVNLAIGITLINFVEVNFAILTPYILAEFGFTKPQTALAMSSLGFCDLVIRFLIPLITSKINLSNKTFFIIGILGMCIGRVFLSFTHDFYTMLGIFIWLGLNKAFRTVFWSLIIPGYVPLKRLPAAAGLQLLMTGTFSFVFGPFLGFIRDRTNYAFTMNFMNLLCVLAIALWLIEDFIRNLRQKSKPVTTSEEVPKK